MLKLIIIIAAIFLGNFAYCQKCTDLTFQKHSIKIEEKSKKRFQTVTGCITSENVAYKNLEKIVVFGQSIPVIKKGAVANIPDWFQLILNNNSILKIDSEAFININAHSIALDRNGIKWIEAYAFANLPSVEVIDLEQNRLTLLPERTFVNLPNLTTISFSRNHIECFNQKWFYQTPNLEDLFLDNNELWTIPKEAFSTLTKLKRLTLEFNFIEHIHKYAFFRVNNLEEIHLNNNRIKTLDIDFSSFNSLSFLSLDGNFLTYLSLHSLRHVKSTLTNMYIHANPWQCSCLQKILKWGKDNKILIFWECRNETLTCVVPDHNPEKCSDRPDSDFNSDIRQNFNRDCVKITYV